MLLDASEESRRHFLGSIVCISEKHQPGIVPGYQVIDGQQRLMTLSLLLCAVRNTAREKGWEELAAEVEEIYLIHKFKKSRERYKIFPRIRDRECYIALVDNQECNGDSQVNLAYKYQLDRLDKEGCSKSEDTLRKFFTVLTNQIDVVLITLEGENPYKIFKSLNSTGVDLGEGDLIRNVTA